MSNVTGTIRGSSLNQGATSPTIYNVNVLTANTEVSQALSSGTKMFTIRARGNSTIKLAFTSGNSGTLYVTIPAGANYSVSNLNLSATLYFQTSKSNEVVEIIEWL